MPWDLRTWHARLERLSSPTVDVWTPAIDVYETADAFIVAAEVPGVSREQVDLSVERSRLMIRGQRPDQHGNGAIQHYHQVERGFGSFARTFEFAVAIDVDGVTADLSEGVLTVRLPKVPPPPAQRITVK